MLQLGPDYCSVRVVARYGLQLGLGYISVLLQLGLGYSPVLLQLGLDYSSSVVRRHTFLKVQYAARSNVGSCICFTACDHAGCMCVKQCLRSYRLCVLMNACHHIGCVCVNECLRSCSMCVLRTETASSLLSVPLSSVVAQTRF